MKQKIGKDSASDVVLGSNPSFAAYGEHTRCHTSCSLEGKEEKPRILKLIFMHSLAQHDDL